MERPRRRAQAASRGSRRLEGVGMQGGEQGGLEAVTGHLAAIVPADVDDPRWRSVSPGLALALGYRPADLVDESPLEFVADDRDRAMRELMMTTGEVDGATTLLRTVSGVVPVAYSVTAVDGGRLWISR